MYATSYQKLCLIFIQKYHLLVSLSIFFMQFVHLLLLHPCPAKAPQPATARGRWRADPPGVPGFQQLFRYPALMCSKNRQLDFFRLQQRPDSQRDAAAYRRHSGWKILGRYPDSGLGQLHRMGRSVKSVSRLIQRQVPVHPHAKKQVVHPAQPCRQASISPHSFPDQAPCRQRAGSVPGLP